MTSENNIPTNSESKPRFALSRAISRIPGYTKIVFLIFVLAIIIHITAILFTPFSDFFTEKIASVFRTVLATITGILPFSIAETLLLMLPVLMVIYFAFSFHNYIKCDRKISTLVYKMLSLIMIMYSIAVFTFFTGYSNSTLDKKLNIDAQPVTAQNLRDTADKIYYEIDKLENEIKYGDDHFSIMPYSIAEMSDKLIDAYDVCCKKYPFLHNIPSRVKPIALSEGMSYTHITGVYTFFTGEANIDAAFPDFTLPFTAAHEFAHQRGIARENEANFIAFLVCINSDDPYIQYSGYLNMLKYLLNALSKADPEIRSDFYYSMSYDIKAELAAESRFFNKYRESTISKVSNTINDTYLKLQGTEGAVSYGMVVDLAVAYYETNDPIR